MRCCRSVSRRSFFLTAIGGLTGLASGCGTILYPERRGQPHGPLDWTVVGLDAIGLLLFFVPGVIAFAVDFSNGTIYLPAQGYGGTSESTGAASRFRAVSLGGPHPSMREVEAAVRRETDVEIRLKRDRFFTKKLASRDELQRAAAFLERES